MYNVFIDGSEGTTGLRIVERLKKRKNLNVITLHDEKRKDINERIKAALDSDLSILCLPDSAAKEIVSLLPEHVKICDTSTAHRTNDAWVYGFPEIEKRRSDIIKSNRTSIPGCHASGFISIVAPLIEFGLLHKKSNLSAFSITGYTGGGKSMIADYEDNARSCFLESPRTYALSLHHKHIPEMCKVAKLLTAPLFTPIVADYARGMSVHIPVFKSQLLQKAGSTNIDVVLKEYYNNEKGVIVHDTMHMPENGFLPANLCCNSDMLEIFCFENEEQVLLVSVFDNLGKGSSGAAIQCMNLMLGLPEREGLE